MTSDTYVPTEAQVKAASILVLKGDGWKFSNWISAQTGKDEEGTMVFVKRGFTRYGRHYAEIEPDGTVNK